LGCTNNTLEITQLGSKVFIIIYSVALFIQFSSREQVNRE